jgi:hypothetical protein
MIDEGRSLQGRGSSGKKSPEEKCGASEVGKGEFTQPRIFAEVHGCN